MHNLTLYKTRIFQYFKDTRFSTPLTDYTHFAQLQGQQCSDSCYLYAVLQQQQLVKLHFVVQGCIVAVACANMLAQMCQNQPLSILQNLDQATFLTTVVQLPIDDSRLECAMLAFKLCKKVFFP